MPVHRVPMLDVEESIAKIEATETIVSVTAVGVGALLVVTAPKATRRAGAKETRG